MLMTRDAAGPSLSLVLLVGFIGPEPPFRQQILFNLTGSELVTERILSLQRRSITTSDQSRIERQELPKMSARQFLISDICSHSLLALGAQDAKVHVGEAIVRAHRGILPQCDKGIVACLMTPQG